MTFALRAWYAHQDSLLLITNHMMKTAAAIPQYKLTFSHPQDRILFCSCHRHV